MDATRKAARSWLKSCTRTDLDWAMFNARLTERQREVVELMFSCGMSTIAISLKIHADPSVVKNTLKLSYDKLAKVIAL